MGAVPFVVQTVLCRGMLAMRGALMTKHQWKKKSRSCRRRPRGALLALLSIFTMASRVRTETRPEFEGVVVDSLDPSAWNGIVFLAKAFGQPASFAMRLGSRGSKYLVG